MPRKKDEVQELKKISQKNAMPEEQAADEHSAEERINQVLDKIAFLQLPNEEKEALSIKIKEESESDALYWIEIILSSLIATFGLLQNSVAVIIGAMLIAPLLRPIQGIAFGMSTGQQSHFWRSSRLLIGSVIASIGVAALFTYLVPLRSETAEIIARTSPNLLDLFIAIASGILALLALSYQKLSESIAGVAMAAALMPPLAVVGIELALGQYDLAWGSFFLFLTNLFAILVVGLFIFIFYGFYPHQILSQKRTLQNAFFLMLVIGLISIPLLSSLMNIADRVQLQRNAELVLNQALSDTIAGAKMDSLVLEGFDEDSAKFVSVIKIDENQEFFLETRESIREELGNALDREVTLEMEIIPIASIISQKERDARKLPDTREQIKTELKSLISDEELKTTILSLDVVSMAKDVMDDEEEAEEGSSHWAVKTVFTLPAGEAFSEDTQKSLETKLSKTFSNELFTFIWTPLSQKAVSKGPAEETANDVYLREMTLKWDSFFSDSLPEGASVDGLEIAWHMKPTPEGEPEVSTDEGFDTDHIDQYMVAFDLYIPEGADAELASFEGQVKRFTRRAFAHPVLISMRTFPFAKQDFIVNPARAVQLREQDGANSDSGENEEEERSEESSDETAEPKESDETVESTETP